MVLVALACGPRGHWPPRPAEHPPTAAELAFYELTVRDTAADERATFARALAAKGFTVVDDGPRKGQLEVTLTHEGGTLVATLAVVALVLRLDSTAMTFVQSIRHLVMP